VQVREDGRDATAAGFMTRELGAPGSRVEAREDELVHGVIDRVGIEQGIANFGKRIVGLKCHGIPIPLRIAMMAQTQVQSK